MAKLYEWQEDFDKLAVATVAADRAANIQLLNSVFNLQFGWYFRRYGTKFNMLSLTTGQEQDETTIALGATILRARARGVGLFDISLSKIQKSSPKSMDIQTTIYRGLPAGISRMDATSLLSEGPSRAMSNAITNTETSGKASQVNLYNTCEENLPPIASPGIKPLTIDRLEIFALSGLLDCLETDPTSSRVYSSGITTNK